MKRLRLCFAVCLTLCAAARADVAADIAALKALEIKELCPLIIDTPLVKDGRANAAIVPGSGGPCTAAATKLQRAVAERTGVTLPIVPAEQITDVDWAGRELVVIGNLLTNPVFARLYNNYFVCADAAYTGAGGYELRSVHNPWGTGHNAIALGAQDTAGIEAAVGKFAEIAATRGKQGELVLPRMFDLQLSKEGRRAPLDEVLTADAIAGMKKSLDSTASKAGQDGSLVSSTLLYAMRYHRTGDPGWLELFRHGLRHHLRYYETDEYINKDGPRRYDRDFRDSYAWRMIVAWDLLEEDPSWTDAERLEMANHILRLNFECNLKNGWDSDKAIEKWLKFDGILHNHQSWPGLANLFGGWYFTRHYHLPIAGTWLKIAQTMFHSASRSAKPQEDAAGYEWIPRRHLLTYALASGDRTYIDEGHAAETGRSLLMAIDPLGHQPAWGDSENITATSQMAELLSLLEYVLRDGRYRWMAEKLGLDARGEASDPHWTDVAARQPDELVGISASYLPRLHYAMLGTDHEDTAPFRAANLPFEQTFDKLVLRSGLATDADYLMLDGYAAGNHGHFDGNAITAFTSCGAHWLIDAEYIRNTPKYHCAITVQRDGITRPMPTNVRLDAAAWYGGGAITRTTMPGYNGIAWTRSIVNVAGRYTAVIDEATAEQPGEYNLRCCWRVLGQAQLSGNTLELRQREKGFALRNLTNQTQELVFMRNSGELIYSQTVGLPIHQLYQFENRHLAAGEKVRFINVFAASSNDVPRIDAALVGDRQARVTVDARSEIIGVDGFAGEVKSDASVYRLASDHLWLAGARSVHAAGKEIVQRADAVCVRGDANGIALGQPEAVPAPGLKSVETFSAPSVSAGSLPLERTIAALAKLAPPPRPGSGQPAGTAGESKPLWRFADFQPRSELLEVRRIEANPAPRNPKQPLEYLIDGKFTGSTDSCALPTGASATITLDLGYEQQIGEVRVHAWEAYEHWKTENMRVALSNDGFVSDVRDMGEVPVTHVGTNSGNVETLHTLAIPKQSARYVRITADPLTPKAQVYLSEIELFGSRLGLPPKLTTLVSADLNGDGQPETIVGSGAGDLVAIDRTGKELWRQPVGTGTLSVAAGPLTPGAPPVVVCGADDVTLRVYSGEGKLLASITPPEFRYVQSRVRNITLHDLDGDGTAEIVVGCDSWQYMAYKLENPATNPALKLDWKSVFYAHEATVSHIADLDGDGAPEIVAGNNYYSLQLLDRRGKLIGNRGGVGPEQTAVTSVPMPGSQQRAVVLGFDSGDVMAFDAKGKPLWQVNAGDRISTLRTDEIAGRPQLVAASEGSLVAAFDAAGQSLWRRNLGVPAKRLVRAGDQYFVATAHGAVRLSLAGEILSTLPTPAAALDLVVAGDRIVALLADGSVVAFAAR